MPHPSALLLLLAVTGTPAAAGTVYKCSGTDGRVIYQDTPCAKAQRQQTLQLPDDTTAPSPPASAATRPDKPPPVAAPAPPPTPGVPLVQLYQCRHAVDGSLYVSRNGRPPPFRAPLGMLSALSTPLGEVYGSPNHAGISAPEANRGRVGAGLVANHYVWVQDQCRPLSVSEICGELRDEQEQNTRKLQHAFKSDRPPLQRRDDELQAQLTHC
ncbi:MULTISPECIES: DUF4124 domain-containing protein [unclassified Rhodanobacter]|uniref:DUF4124 domain-containing protein n=1 Tax=unclassified Rhodanobacter TaxID=2621553 RepID=UPI001BDF2E61|nr:MULTISPECIES: DUF4124 domain-containing protein [unclassified Rhodanobacter]MBT2143717.1 DUF4124 domain-containing protein [Rhodanobacter sp. LX-99]MBT2147209.1 DUF4124 domain-containing protein [Rhodanobacter sp. LX-100]